MQSDRTARVTETAAGPLATSGGLDDRLGVYTILHLLPRLGILTDVLLTTDEEIGQTTAFEFETDKQYDHIIEFDRAGTDVVCYQYTDEGLDQRIRNAGARPGEGIYSDIAELEHLQAKACNWGIGYQDYHSPRAHAWLEDTFKQVARYETFYHQNEGIYLPHSQALTPDHYADTLDDVADCGDLYDPHDPNSYVLTEGLYTLCARCAEGRY